MKGIALLTLPTLAACAASLPPPMPLAASGPTDVALAGQAFIADLQPVADGAQIIIARDGTALALDEGKLAKDVALAFCGGRGQGLDPAALGAFQDGSWVFDGGCV